MFKFPQNPYALDLDDPWIIVQSELRNARQRSVEIRTLNRLKRWSTWKSSGPSHLHPKLLDPFPDFDLQAAVPPLSLPKALKDTSHFACLWNPQLFNTVPTPDHWIESNIPSRLLLQAMERGVIELAPKLDSTKGMSRIHILDEQKKRRYRLVADVLAANISFLAKDTDIKFRPIEALIGNVMQHECVASVDFRSFYHQFKLEPQVRDFFRFAAEGKIYRFMVLPMGFVGACTTAQHFSEYLAQACARNIFSDVYLDNILLAGTRADVEQAFLHLRHMCASLNVTIGEMQLPGSVVTHRGIVFDVGCKTWGIKSSLVDKLADFPDVWSSARWAEWHTAVSRVAYCMRIMQIPRCFTFELWKWAYKERNAFQWIKPPPIVISQFMQIVSRLRSENTKRWVPRRSPDLCVYSDASLKGSGGVVKKKGYVTEDIFGAPWQTHEKTEAIAILELKAIWRSLSNWRVPCGSAIHLLSDNSVAVYALRKGFSPSRKINDELALILQLNIDRRLLLSHISFIPSRFNLADGPSRDESCWSEEYFMELYRGSRRR